MEINPKESSWSKAVKDTESFRQNNRWWFRTVDVLGSGAIAGLTAWMLWDRSTLKSWQVGIITFSVFVVGIFFIYGLIYLWNLFRAPYRQRNEVLALLFTKPKPLFLTNRDMLLRAIAEAEMATIEVADNIENLKLQEKGNVIFQDAETWDKLLRIRGRFKNACEALEKEILVAGKSYEPILKPLYLFMQSSAILNASPVPSDKNLMTFKYNLEQLVTETRNKIDEFS